MIVGTVININTKGVFFFLFLRCCNKSTKWFIFYIAADVILCLDVFSTFSLQLALEQWDMSHLWSTHHCINYMATKNVYNCALHPIV